MTLRLILAALAGLSLSACLETGGSDGTALTTEQAFRGAVVGRTITFDGSNSFVINANGTVSGPWDGSGITGTWYWDGQYWCREIAIGGTARPLDCQSWVVNGNRATVTRDRGAGSSFVYTVR